MLQWTELLFHCMLHRSTKWLIVKGKSYRLFFWMLRTPGIIINSGRKKCKDTCWNLETNHLWLPSACIIFSFHSVYKTKWDTLVTHASVNLLVVGQQKPARARPLFSIIAIIIVSWRPSQVFFNQQFWLENDPIPWPHELSPLSSCTQAHRTPEPAHSTGGWAAGPDTQVPTSHALRNHKQLASTNGKNTL